MRCRHFSCFKLGFKAVLRAVCLVGNHHDVAAVRQHGEEILVLARHELLDGRKDNAARGPVGQLGAQILPRAHLHRLLAQQVLRQAEHAKQLAVQVIAVGDDHDGRVLHRGFLHHPGGKAGHGDALAAALGVPDHAALAFDRWRAVRARGFNDPVDGQTHGMKLVVAGNFLDQRAVVLEQHEVAQVVQQVLRRQHAAHQRLQLVEFAERVQRHAVNGAPGHEALRVGGQRSQQRLGAVRDDQDFVGLEDIRNLLFVGLDLVVGFPDIGLLVGRVLQLDQYQRQTVDEQDDVRAARVFRPLEGELVDRQPFVAPGLAPVNKPHEVTPRFAVLLVLHRHAAHQQLVEMPVGRQQRRNP